LCKKEGLYENMNVSSHVYKGNTGKMHQKKNETSYQYKEGVRMGQEGRRGRVAEMAGDALPNTSLCMTLAI
jgi:hypothetical protein